MYIIYYLQKLRIQIVHLIAHYYNCHSHLVWNPVLMSISLKNFGCLYAFLMLTISPKKTKWFNDFNACLVVSSPGRVTRAFGTDIMKISASNQYILQNHTLGRCKQHVLKVCSCHSVLTHEVIAFCIHISVKYGEIFSTSTQCFDFAVFLKCDDCTRKVVTNMQVKVECTV